MNNYDEISIIIEEINAKLKEIDNQMIVVEDIKPTFGNMDTFIPELESAYKDFDESLSNGIFRTQELNRIVSNEALNEYYDIYQELNSKCSDIMNDLLESTNIVKTPIEVIDTTPVLVTTHNDFFITDDFINRQVELIRPIEIGRIDNDVIPLPTPVQPEIEVLEL